jgi:hypothetical protein
MDFEFLSSNLQIAYPFTDDVTVVRPSGSVLLAPLVAALRIYTYDQREADLYMDEIDLRSSDSFATLSTASVTLRWSDDDVQFSLTDGGNATARVVKYGAWIVVSWLHSTEDFVVHVVFPAAQVEGAAPETFRFWKSTEDIKVLAGLVKQGPGKVKRIYVKRGSTLSQLAGPGEEVTIEPGFNMEIGAGSVVTADTGRQLTRVAINAVPGAGLGKYLICKNDRYLLTLNGVAGDDIGNVNLGPEECYWLDVPLRSGPTPVDNPQHNITKVGTLQPNQLRVRNACGPCCSCEDYVKTYDHLKGIWDTAKQLAARYNALRDSFSSLVSDWGDKQEGDNILAIGQYGPDSLLVQVSIWNDTTDFIIDDILAVLSFSLPDGVDFVNTMSALSSISAPVYVKPDDLDTEPKITVTTNLEPFQAVFWTSTWTLSGISVGDVVELTAILSGGVTKSKTEDLTWLPA